jgi:hypothetical protein
MEHNEVTANGVPITDGLWVWNNNLDRVQVSYADTFGAYFVPGESYWDGWFKMRTVTGERSDIMNGERMTTVHPFTRERA